MKWSDAVCVHDCVWGWIIATVPVTKDREEETLCTWLLLLTSAFVTETSSVWVWIIAATSVVQFLLPKTERKRHNTDVLVQTATNTCKQMKYEAKKLHVDLTQQKLFDSPHPPIYKYFKIYSDVFLMNQGWGLCCILW